MKKIIAILLALTMLLTACSNSPSPSGETPSGGDEMKQYTTIYHQEFTTLNYLWTNVSDNIYFAYNTIDSLIEFDQYGVMQPCLAKDIQISEDGLTYTFTLREGVKWYTSDGEEYAEVTAQDFVDAMKWILTPENGSYQTTSVFGTIENAKKYFDGEVTDFAEVGVKAVDTYVLEYKIMAPMPYFLKMTSFPSFFPVYGPFLEEMGEDFATSAETTLYCGAYICSVFEPENMRILEANRGYWNKENISIERITYRYNKEAASIGPELFLRGEITDIPDALPGAVVEQWQNDPEKAGYLQEDIYKNLSYFMLFNYDPKFDAEYEPENWKLAVNNENFRKSIYFGLDKAAALTTINPTNPESLIINTFTRPNLVNLAGVDYTQLDALKDYSNTVQFNAEKALEFKAAAMEELKDTVSFPVKIMMPYNVSKADAVNRMQVVEQQLENLLGSDFIDIILVSFPSTDYNMATRGSGQFALMETGWGPDFTDPMGMADVFCIDYAPVMAERYGKLYLAESENAVNKVGTYESMMLKAHAETTDLAARYTLFSEAEAYLLDNAYVIPYYISGGGYRATMLDTFTGYTGQMGRNGQIKLKGAKILEKPRTPEEYAAAKADFEAKRQEALENAVYN